MIASYQEYRFIREGNCVAVAWQIYGLCFRQGHRSRLLPDIHPIGEEETVVIVDNDSEELLQAYRDGGFEGEVLWF